MEAGSPLRPGIALYHRTLHVDYIMLSKLRVRLGYGL